MRNEIDALIEKAKRSVKAARRLQKAGDYDFAVARAYYSLFYVSEALLLKKGQSYSKHAAVISAIFDQCIKTGELPKEFHRTLHKAFDLRQEGDYMCSATVTKEIAEELLGEVEACLKIAVEKL